MNNIEKIKNKLKMRKAVGIILMRDDGLVWTGKRKDGPGIRNGEKDFKVEIRWTNGKTSNYIIRETGKTYIFKQKK